MTSTVCSTSVVLRRFSCHIRQRWFNARLTCSIVISGFFPPQPIGVFGDKSHHDQAQDHVPHQPHVTSPFEMAEADFALGHAKGVFDIPATERHAQQPSRPACRGRVGDEILYLVGCQIARHDQPMGASQQSPAGPNKPGPARTSHSWSSNVKRARAYRRQSRSIQCRAEACQVVSPLSFPAFRGLWPRGRIAKQRKLRGISPT